MILWAITYGIIYTAIGFHAHNGAIYAGLILILYPAYVIVKNFVSFYKKNKLTIISLLYFLVLFFYGLRVDIYGLNHRII